jgi:fatty-acyl-CoA synthase
MIAFPKRRPSDTAVGDIAGTSFGDWVRVPNTYAVFRNSAETHADRKALTHVETGAADEAALTLTYRELLNGVSRTAHVLRACGAAAGTSVGLLLPNMLETYLLLYGAQAAAIAFPLNYLLTPAHLADLLRAAGTRILVALGPVAGTDIWSKAMMLREELGSTLDCIIQLGGEPVRAPGIIYFHEALKEAGSTLSFASSAGPSDVAAMFHTGGTTGAPKIVELTHRNELAAAFGFCCAADLGPHDVATNGLPLFHVGGAITVSLSSFMAGAQLLNLSPAGFRNPVMVSNYWRLVQKHRVTVACSVPTALGAIAMTPIGDADIRSLRFASAGGALTPRAAAQRFEDVTGRKVHEVYGMTEAAGCISVDPSGGERVLGSAGYAIAFTHCEVRQSRADGSLGETCAAGVPGVLTVHGANVSPGYRNLEHNRGVFTSDGGLVTGDIAVMGSDGRITITGRSKDLIIRSGHNIDPAMIEAAALSYPGVAAAAAVGQPDRYAGEVPVCYVVALPGAEVDPAELRRYLETCVAERPAWPRQIYVIDSLPLTGVGKIYKPALRCNAAERLVAELVADLPAAVVSVMEDGRRGMVVSIKPKSADRLGKELAARLDGFLFHWETVGDP